MFACNKNEKKDHQMQPQNNKTAKDILGNPNYLAMSYGGYRKATRDIQPTLEELKEDMRIMEAMGVKILRTYNVHFDQTANILEAIRQLKDEDTSFEMYVMLGIWIDCKNAFYRGNAEPNHNEESKRNPIEVKTAVALAKKYPEIVKIIAVGNEAMVKWATSYYVRPGIILKWVTHLQELKKSGELSKDLWITSSDNFASWGGGESSYHTQDLTHIIEAVDYVSMHTYPMHDTHYSPVFWGVEESELHLTDIQKVDAAMLRAKEYAISQYTSVKKYINSLGIEKPIHIGETGWASYTNDLYGDHGSRATDQYKEGVFYKHMRDWTNKAGMSCFYFQAFDEIWKDSTNHEGSENHFGLFTLDGQAKFALWDAVDKGVFKGLTRNGHPIKKTYNGNKQALLKDVKVPPLLKLEEAQH